MKPKDLKPLFTFDTRRPLLEDGVFYVPLYYAHHEKTLLPPLADYFGNKNRHCIEYCSGNGDWILQKAISEPDKNWIAVEKRFDRVRKIWAKMKNHSIHNLLIVCAEAFTFTQHYLPSNVIEHVYINFPDPWPKMRHTKHRLINKSFLDELGRILQPSKGITLVTDDHHYLESVIEQLSYHPQFKSYFPPPFFTTHLPNYGTSWFENLWRKKGKKIHYTHYICYAHPD